MSSLVTVAGLSMGWDDTLLLEDASFEVAQGEVFVIVGTSGCGKSTLLRHLVGLEPPRSGTIEVAGVSGGAFDDRPPPFGVTFQSGALFGSMTVADNLALPLRQWTDLPEDAVSAIVRAKLRLVGLHDAELLLPSALSGGMRKRAAIARAMVLEPPLLFLDEPSAGLDPVTSAELDALLLSLNRALGITVVLVSHELASIFAIGTSCIMLDGVSRSIIARGDPRVLRDESKDPRVSAFFNRRLAEARP
jgi:phospholipid/cholesterol/gamma-HCH transport system ATP-binding protein